MKVKAISAGFFRGNYINPGTVFEIGEKDKIGQWMRPLEVAVAKEAEPKRIPGAGPGTRVVKVPEGVSPLHASDAPEPKREKKARVSDEDAI